MARARGDRGLQARAGYALAGALLNAGRPSDALAEVSAVHAGLGAFATEDPDGLRLTAELARCHLMNGDPKGASALIEATLPVVERLGLRDVIAELLPSKGWALAAEERPIEAIALHRGALAFAERDGRFRAEMRSRMNLSAVAGWEDTREAFEVSSVGSARARERGYDAWAITLAGNACGMAELLGEWDWIVRIVADLGLEERDGPWVQGPVGTLAEIRAYQGRFEEADRLHERVRTSVGSLTDRQLIAGVGATAATIAFARGDLDRATAEYEASQQFRLDAGLGDEPGGAVVAIERHDLARLRAAAEQPRGGRLRDALLDALGGAAAVLEGRDEGLLAIDAAAALEMSEGVRFLAALLLRARAMLAPEDPGAPAAATEAVAVFHDLGAVTMLRGLEAFLPDRRVPTLEEASEVATHD
jgi:tetratricopeptide (TPR) repeat protein